MEMERVSESQHFCVYICIGKSDMWVVSHAESVDTRNNNNNNSNNQSNRVTLDLFTLVSSFGVPYACFHC